MNETENIEKIRDYSRTFVRELGFFRKSIEAVDLTLAQGHLLVEIDRSASMTQRDLACSLGIDPSSASRNLKPLIQRKLVRTLLDERDGRRKILRLTARGKEALRRYDENARSDVKRAFSFLSEQERHVCIEGMRMYAFAWKKANEAKKRRKASI